MSDTIETCLVCKVAWDISHDPPECEEPDHPHAINDVADWSTAGRGLAEEPAQPSLLDAARHGQTRHAEDVWTEML